MSVAISTTAVILQSVLEVLLVPVVLISCNIAVGL